MEQHQQPHYYTVMIPKQDPDPDPDRLAKLLELGDPNFFGSYGNNSSFGTGASAAEASVKVKSGAVQQKVPKLSNASVTTTDEQNDSTEERVSKLLKLGDVNFFGGSPMAEALAARQRGNR